MCGLLALVPQASKNHLAKIALRDPFESQARAAATVPRPRPRTVQGLTTTPVTTTKTVCGAGDGENDDDRAVPQWAKVMPLPRQAIVAALWLGPRFRKTVIFVVRAAPGAAQTPNITDFRPLRQVQIPYQSAATQSPTRAACKTQSPECTMVHQSIACRIPPPCPPSTAWPVRVGPP